MNTSDGIVIELAGENFLECAISKFQILTIFFQYRVVNFLSKGADLQHSLHALDAIHDKSEP